MTEVVIIKAITGPASESSSTITVTSTGSIQCWAQGENGSRLLWAREESLSDVKTHVVVELPERKVEQTGAVLDQEGFMSRTIRHVKELIVSTPRDVVWCLLRTELDRRDSTYLATLRASSADLRAVAIPSPSLRRLSTRVTYSGTNLVSKSSSLWRPYKVRSTPSTQHTETSSGRLLSRTMRLNWI
jgi:hypothetical protein